VNVLEASAKAMKMNRGGAFTALFLVLSKNGKYSIISGINPAHKSAPENEVPRSS
jgi:hypothetical protein